MNSTAIHLNNAAIDSLQGGNIVRGFNILLKACSDQSRRMDNNNASMKRRKHRGHPGSSTRCQLRRMKAQEHIFEYRFQDCSNLFRVGGFRDCIGSWNCPQEMLCLKFLRLDSPLSSNELDSMCNSGISWVLGYNLSILCAFIGLQISDEAHHYIRKAMALLEPIHRTIMRAPPSSLFWVVLKLSVLNNYALVLRECSLDTNKVLSTFSILLRDAHETQKLDPIDIVRFERNIEALNSQDDVAAAA